MYRLGIRSLPVMLVMSAAFAAGGWAQAPEDLERAHALYQQTRYSDAVKILDSAQHKTAAALALLGQCYYGLEDFKKATDSLENAVTAESNNAVYQDWLGRAYGRRAETAFALTAASLASKARDHFEQAVKLDPMNTDAADDLFEYYLQAPGIMGGGEDKAQALSEQIRDKAPGLYHSMQARLAEHRKQFPAAEDHLKQAIQAEPSQPGHLVELARFLAKQGRTVESEAAFDKAQQMAPEKASIKFDRARTYIDAKRNPDQARQLLQEYLAANLTPDDPPRAEAQRLLQKIK